MKKFSGIEFKKKHNNKKFYKLTTESEHDYGFQYNTGVNIYSKPIKSYYSSGLEFVNELGLFFQISKTIDKNNVKYIREVEILDDSIIYAIKNKFKTDKFSLGERIEIIDFHLWNDIDFCLKAVEVNNKNINFVKNISPDFIIKLLKIQLLKHKSNEYIFDFLISKIKNLDINNILNIKKAIITKYPHKFNNIIGDNQEQELCELGVKLLGSNIQYVNEQTTNQCWNAIEGNSENIKYIKNPTKSMLINVIKENSKNIKIIDSNFLDDDLSNFISQKYPKKAITLTKGTTPINKFKILITEHDKLEFVTTIKALLAQISITTGKENKLVIALEIMDYCIENLDFLKANPKFGKVVIKKLEEFKNGGDFTEQQSKYYLDKITNYCGDHYFDDTE